jgi:hypothetical protein
MNYDFQLDAWLDRFPLREKYGHYSADDITSPCDLCNVEWLRREMRDEFDWGEPVPVDIFVLSQGEPENRFATKIGGLPYRPADEPWPCSADGRSLALIAQFHFTNSRDIVGETPGDLLLVFGDDSDGFISSFHFEWQDLGIRNLITPAELPRDSMQIAPCFGNRCRMQSFPEAQLRTPWEKPQCHGKEVWTYRLIPQFQATQIGRAPYIIQSNGRSPYDEDESSDVVMPSNVQHLCTIASVQPDAHQPYPWVNVPEPRNPEGKWNYGDNNLMIGDVGCIYITIDEEGRLHIGEESY